MCVGIDTSVLYLDQRPRSRSRLPGTQPTPSPTIVKSHHVSGRVALGREGGGGFVSIEILERRINDDEIITMNED